MNAQVHAMKLAAMAAKVDVTDVMDARVAPVIALMSAQETAQLHVARHVRGHAKVAPVALEPATEAVFKHVPEIVQTLVKIRASELAPPLVQETAQDVQQHALLTAQETALTIV